MAGSNGRAKRHFFGGTGLYIALFLGVTALAVAGYWTLLPKNTTDKDAENVSSQVELPVQDETPQMPEAELPQEAAKPAEPVEEPPEDLTVMDEATGVEDTVPAMESETDAQPVAPRLVVAPLVGEEVAAFSVDELKYNETLGDWRTHDGIDIAAEVGTQVIAACSGVVTAVRDDDMMGTMVNGRMTVRDERSDRVRDPAMDREEMIIDREKRQGRRPAGAQGGATPSKREPFQGALPN